MFFVCHLRTRRELVITLPVLKFITQVKQILKLKFVVIDELLFCYDISFQQIEHDKQKMLWNTSLVVYVMDGIFLLRPACFYQLMTILQ